MENAYEILCSPNPMKKILFFVCTCENTFMKTDLPFVRHGVQATCLRLLEQTKIQSPLQSSRGDKHGGNNPFEKPRFASSVVVRPGVCERESRHGSSAGGDRRTGPRSKSSKRWVFAWRRRPGVTNERTPRVRQVRKMRRTKEY